MILWGWERSVTYCCDLVFLCCYLHEMFIPLIGKNKTENKVTPHSCFCPCAYLTREIWYLFEIVNIWVI